MVFSAQWANEPTNIFSMRPGSREYRPLDLPEGRILAISSSGEMAILLGPDALEPWERWLGCRCRAARRAKFWKTSMTPIGRRMDPRWRCRALLDGKNRIEYPIGTVRFESDGRSPISAARFAEGRPIAFFEYDNAYRRLLR